jgi:hypothetical protein
MDILIRNNKKSDETNVDDLLAKHLIIFRFFEPKITIAKEAYLYNAIYMLYCEK